MLGNLLYSQFGHILLCCLIQVYMVIGESNTVHLYVDSYGSASTTVNFATSFTVIPSVSAWARGNPQCLERYSVSVQTVTNSGFVAVLNCAGYCSCYDNQVKLYWNAVEITSSNDELLGDTSVYVNVDIPKPTWIATPSISGYDRVFEILGREVHLSVVYQLLSEQTRGEFPVTQTEGDSVDILLNIKADTVYVDQPVVEFPGLSAIEIKARKLVSNGGLLNLTGPKVCNVITDDVCQNPTKADMSYPGINGKPGVESPSLNIMAQQIVGTLQIKLQGSDGSTPEAGGNGRAGNDMTNTPPSLSRGECCDKCYFWTYEDKRCRGKSGYSGEGGNDGRPAGLSRNGGSTGSVTVYSESVSGFVTLQQIPGYGGVPAEHGYGGKGGNGGNGGCGFRCNRGYWCEGIVCKHRCSDYVDCDNRGAHGNDGLPGNDGFSLYGVPTQGQMGGVGNSDLRTVSSVKQWFESETDLLEVMRRHAETLYQRNNLGEASDIFEFLLSVTNENSLLHKNIEVRLQWIKAGFDYYGHTKNYAPVKSFPYWDGKTNKLLSAGEKVEDSFNSVSDQVSDIILVCETIQHVVTETVTEVVDDLEENYERLTDEKQKMVNGLSEIDEAMSFEMSRIEDLIPRAMTQAQGAMQDQMGGLIKGLIGVTVNIIKGEVVKASVNFAKLIYDIASMPGCEAPELESTAETMEDRLDFGYDYEHLNPEDMDFSSIKLDIALRILNDLSTSKNELISQLSCAYDYAQSDMVGNLTEAINNYFNDGEIRVNDITGLMNTDIQRKEIEESISSLETVKQQVDTLVNGIENSDYVQAKINMADGLFSFYQKMENIMMRSLYELSKAFEFSCLWEFDALSKYSSLFSDQVIVSNTGSLEGMFQINRIRQQLETEKSNFLEAVQSSQTFMYTKRWEFNNVQHKEVFDQLVTSGIASVSLKLDPNDVSTTGCSNCYNTRLSSLYVEVMGSSQSATVPNELYVRVAHKGDSYFLIPGNNTTVKMLQQTPENAHEGTILSFDRSNYISSITDPALADKFTETSLCDDSTKFFGNSPCKSPFASYMIYVPRDDGLDCSTDPNDKVYGTNCKDLDYSKFTTIRIYANMRAWGDYPVQRMSIV